MWVRCYNERPAVGRMRARESRFGGGDSNNDVSSTGVKKILLQSRLPLSYSGSGPLRSPPRRRGDRAGDACRRSASRQTTTNNRPRPTLIARSDFALTRRVLFGGSCPGAATQIRNNRAQSVQTDGDRS